MISWLLQFAALIAASLCGFAPFVFRTFWFSVILPMCRFLFSLTLVRYIFLHFEVESSAYLVLTQSHWFMFVDSVRWEGPYQSPKDGSS